MAPPVIESGSLQLVYKGKASITIVQTLLQIIHDFLYNLQRFMRQPSGELLVFFPYTKELHPRLQTYQVNAPLKWASRWNAKLHHYYNQPDHNWRSPYVIEVEHLLVLTGAISDWPERKSKIGECSRIVSENRCKKVIFVTHGLMDIGRRYLTSNLYPKLTYLYYAASDPYPRKNFSVRTPRADRLKLLAVASRYWDKGIPQILEVFSKIRSICNKARLCLVCNSLPENFMVPDGVQVYTCRPMSVKLKHDLYSRADIVISPVYSDGMICHETSAYGLPLVTTRIHHGDEFVDGGKAGFAIEPPIWAYGNAFDKVYDWWEFERKLIDMNENGAFDDFVDQMTDVVLRLMNDSRLYTEMSHAARAFYEREFTPEIRKQRLLSIYREVLAEL